MFKEILQIIPRLDVSSLNKMEKTLSGRFTRIAKGFGKGLKGVMKGGAFLGSIMVLIDKFLNPLKEVNEAIERTLGLADTVVTNAGQFDSTPGELFKLQKLAQTQGLDAEGLGLLLVKFQTALAEAAQDPNKQTSVRAFAGEKNIVKAFFEFIQALQKMDKNQQVLVQQEVFGEKQTLKMAEFLQTDFGALTKRMGPIMGADLDPSLNKLSNLEGRQAELKAALEMKDIFQKGRVINESMINSMARQEALELEKENLRLEGFRSLQTVNESVGKIMLLVEKGVMLLGDLITKIMPSINSLIDKVDKISKSGFIRGIFGGDK
jgi:hypothetical protein